MVNLGSAVLDPLMRADPVGPRITYYDDATGERIELSTASLANWAAKTGNLLRDELGAGAGSRVAVFLPAHWQTAAVVFGIWWIGAEVVPPAGGSAATWGNNPAGGSAATRGNNPAGGSAATRADIAFCTAGGLAEADAAVGGGMGEVAVLSLDPFGKPVPDLPFGVTDYATAVRVHGDHVVPEQRPGPALGGRSADEVLSAALASAAERGLRNTDRVLSVADWHTIGDYVDQLLAVFATGASLVQVNNPDAAAQQRRWTTEKITRLPAG